MAGKSFNPENAKCSIFKGPLFYQKYMPEIKSKNNDMNNFESFKSFKLRVKSFVFDIQAEGRPNEWEGQNMPLYYCPGLPRSNREGINMNINYNYD